MGHPDEQKGTTMSKTTRVRLSIALSLAFLAGAAAALAPGRIAHGAGPGEAPPPEAHGLRVGVVDMDRVLQSSGEWRDATEERVRMMDTMKRSLSKLSQRVQVLRNAYDNLPPGGDEQRAKGAETEQALTELQQQRMEYEKQIADHHNETIRSIFGKVSAAVSSYAQENNLDLVLKRQKLEFTGPQTVEQSLTLATAEVLYADPSLDISDAVIERINAAYSGPIEVK